MQFLTMQQELAAQLGLNYQDADTAVLLKRWLNTSAQMIGQAADWPFLRASSPLTVQTVADYSTGTVATTAGSASVTFSGTIANSKDGQFLRTSSSNDWYRLTHTAGSATATIDPVAISTVAAATYTIRKFYYSTTSAVDRILQIRESITPAQLQEVTKEEFDMLRPSPNDTGTPRVYMVAGKDSSDIWQFILWPTPDTTINLYVDYIKALTDMTADTDVSPIPAKWHTNVLIQGARWQGLDFLDDSRADSARSSFYSGLEQMEREILPSMNKNRILRSVDQITEVNPFPLPSNFPNV